jgi:hypothetical protein
MHDQDKKKHKDQSDQPMQYSKFLKGVYDSSDEDEVIRYRVCSILNTYLTTNRCAGNSSLSYFGAKDQDEGRSDFARQNSGRPAPFLLFCCAPRPFMYRIADMRMASARLCPICRSVSRALTSLPARILHARQLRYPVRLFPPIVLRVLSLACRCSPLVDSQDKNREQLRRFLNQV